MSDNEDTDIGSDSNSSDEDWEEVKHRSEASESDDDTAKDEDMVDDLADYNPIVSQEGIQVKVETEGGRRNKDKKDWKARKEAYLRLKENRRRKKVQVNLHKSSFLMSVSRGVYCNNLTINDDEINCLSYSMLPAMFKTKKRKGDVQFVDIEGTINQQFVKMVLKSFREHLELDPDLNVDTMDSSYFRRDRIDERTSLINFFDSKVTSNVSSYSLGFISVLRSIRKLNPKLQVRLLVAIKPISHKPDLILSDKQKKSRKPSSTQSSSKSSSSGFGSGKSSSPEIEEVPAKRTRRGSSKAAVSSKRYAKKASVISEDSEDTDIEAIEVEPPKRRKKLGKNHHLIEMWTEIYLASESKWVPVDPVNNKIGDPLSFSEYLINCDFNYAIAFDDFGHCKEVTSRYTNKFLLAEFKRLRVDEDWIRDTINCFRAGYRTDQEEEEDVQLKLQQECQPLPTTLSEFKNHPLYLLARHLLVAEVIRGPDGKEAVPVGTFRGEAVYNRKDVHPVKSKEFWMRSARVVPDHEDPVKVVKGRKKWDKYAEKYITDIPKFLFAEWQTEPFVPPTAVDGKVPKNRFGNVELFQPEMIPFGCVHIRSQGVAKVAAKLGIDCAQAVVGFDNSKHGVHPVFDGFVVCNEFKSVLMEALAEERAQKREKEREKKSKRVLNNWKRLTRALLIRERLRNKYDDCN